MNLRTASSALAATFLMAMTLIPTRAIADTVTDANAATLADGSATGFVMAGEDATALTAATRRALTLRADPRAWQQLQIAGMNRDFSWRHSARAYESLYQEIIAEMAADA